jgi:hypothetical protein
VDTGAETSPASDSPTGSPSGDTSPSPEPTPDPGLYLGGNTFFDAQGNPTFNPDDPDCAAYVVLEPAITTETTINVTLVIEAGDLAVADEPVASNTRFREVVDNVKLTGSTADDFTVEDLLNKVNGKDGLGIEIEQTALGPYLTSITYGGNTWERGQYYFDGWVFRVNDQFPVKNLDDYPDSEYYEGTGIAQTYLEDGDIVHFFYDYPTDFAGNVGNLAANYVRAVKKSYSSGTLTVGLEIHDTYITPDTIMQMRVNNYESLAGFDEEPITVRLLDEKGGDVSGVTMSYDSETGTAVFTGGNITAGTYIVETDAVLRVISGTDYDSELNKAFFEFTGAYSKISTP